MSGAERRFQPADYALALAKKGLQVFPLTPGAKFPPLVKFKKQSTCDARQVRRLWIPTPQANIGVHCANLMVLDIDPKRGGDDGFDELQIHGDLPPTLTVATPSGGKHLYFAVEGGVPNSVDRLAKGIDIRSNGGYVVAPGSTIEAGAYTLANNAPIAEAPRWLVAAYMERLQPSERRREPVVVGEDGINPETAAAAATRWLAHAQPAIEGQGGDVFTYQTVCRVRDFGVPEDRALEVLQDWNATCEPPWADGELLRKIQNAYHYAQNQFGVDAAEALFQPVPEEERNAPAAQGPKPEPKLDDALYGPDDVNLDQVLNTRYLIKHWLNAQTQALMFGHYGDGKTFIALHLAACLSAQEPWFGQRVAQCGTLYAGYEGEAALARRVFALRREYPGWDMSRFKLRPMQRALVSAQGEGRTKGQAELEGALRAYKRALGQWPGLIIIDPLRNALGGSDSDPALTTAYLEYTTLLSKRTGAAVLTIHHPGHGDQERSRGDSGIESFMDTVIRVDAKRGVIESSKQRDEAKDATHYRLKIVSLGLDRDGDEQTTCVAEEVSQNPMDPILTDAARLALEAAVELIGRGTDFTKGDFRAANPTLNAGVREEIFLSLIQKGYIVKDGRKFLFGDGLFDTVPESV